MPTQIGLRDLLKQLREELTEDTPQSRLFFIDSVEIELRVDIKRQGSGGIHVSILPVAGVEGGVSSALEKGHRITMKLRPLVAYEEARQRLYQGRIDPDDPIVTRLTKDPR